MDFSQRVVVEIALAFALLLSPQRREWLKPWIWLGGLAAFLVFLPNLVWQLQHGFPTLEDLGNVQSTGKNVILNPLEFLSQQVFLLHPLLLPFWVAGLGAFLAGNLRRMRVLGTTYLILLLTMMLLKAKNYYLAPVYPMLFAAGAVAIEDWLAGLEFSRNRIWPKVAIVSYIGIMAAIAVPAATPVLSPENLLAYQRFLGISPPKTEVRHEGPLPQNFGDQFGWEQLAKEVADIYGSLPPGERRNTAIIASNYGEAGAINHLGPAYGLPNAICAHQTYYFWGPPDFDGDTFIWLQWEREWLEPLFESVEEVGTHFHPWGMAEENRPIFLCRGLRQPLTELWPRLKVWN